LLALLSGCAGIILIARAYNGSPTEPRKLAAPIAPRPTIAAARLQSGVKEAPSFVRFNLYDQGIYPHVTHVHQGLLAITIEDFSGGTSGLVVERETGNAPAQVGVVQRSGSQWRGKAEMRLVPGRYKVYMADRPENRALLVVEP
jgi:hypothetical protein